ncbi:HTH-type transcriptional regulator MalT [Cupriavidus laharis]|uniref:HTH-type transcriptional regulator MalT n=1 Tax=Cupriavidus laharis TaxID=151654 RepID=A0ABN7Z979_9BURK|nr:HTH-type transcriptional regulator MalT [Cupriavidus laharis]
MRTDRKSSPRLDDLSFLKPKVTPPKPPLGVIPRARLAGLADRVESSLLTVVRAPAGYGKTTLALAWADALRQRGGLVAWLSLDPEDDEPLRFMHYVLRALQQPMPGHDDEDGGTGLGQIGVNANELLAIVLNEAAEHGEEIYLFIDDFHHIASEPTQELVTALLRHAPSNFHLVLMSRVASTLPLSRLQAQGQVVEVDARDLRFTPEETGSLLRANDMPATHAAPLLALTDGWAAALKLAVLARSGREEMVSASNLGGLARLGELARELLHQLPPDEVAFLEQTAVAERLCAPLCEAMTGVAASQAMLERLERRLLLTRLTEDGAWFSCHQLLRDVLTARLAASCRDTVAARHRDASRWYAMQESWTDAVRHALLAGDPKQAVEWIERCAMGLVKRGDLLTLLNWETQLRTALIGCPLPLRLAIAWAHVLGAYRPDNDRLLDAIEEEAQLAEPEQAARIHWECQVARAIALALGERPGKAGELATACLQSPQGDAWMVNSAYNVQVYDHLKARRWADFYASPVLPYREDEHESNVFSSIYRFTLRGLGHLLQLQAGAAERSLKEALRLGIRHTGTQSLPTTLPAVVLAWLHYERMEFDEAAQLLEGRLSIIPASGFGDGIRMAYAIAARLEYRQGNAERANELLEQAASIAHGLGLVHLEVGVLLERQRLMLQANRLWEAQACAKRIEQLADPGHPDADFADDLAVMASLARSHLDLAEGRPSEAAATFRHWHDRATARGDYHLAMQCVAMLAMASQAAGDTHAAHDALSQYLELAGPNGFKATLLDLGSASDLLLKSYSTGSSAGQLSLPAATLFQAMITPAGQQGGTTIATAGTLLSPRERAILALIAQDKSNKEISRVLSIAPETVKTHVKHIFGKLEVNKRTHAVKRAMSLRLLPPGGQA